MSEVILDADLEALRHSGRAAELVVSFDKRRAKYGCMDASMISQMKAAPYRQHHKQQDKREEDQAQIAEPFPNQIKCLDGKTRRPKIPRRPHVHPLAGAENQRLEITLNRLVESASAERT
ncbi:hypothetical protein [Rhizobium bangladeshense]|uniref:hypothetical protein n=1 Tax=Rhizobium bangladeshense TaxID=1138189 RepID=UPI001C82835C|nr:hypothetical protein [Rhizobium bangladeshense]MBX4898881.1 hypothetical protein [Rhizobium bangladeshense]MBY3584161.1 hypothetical protein [Rhizobium bangladeshense]MBY3616977.1 hypothetical protein [Rhizobium bangladeshense]